MAQSRQRMQMQRDSEIAAQRSAEAARKTKEQTDPLDGKYDAANPYLAALKGARDDVKLRAKADKWESDKQIWDEEAAKLPE